MRRMGGNLSRYRRWSPEEWVRAWERLTSPPSTEQLIRRNEIQRFRLVLATKEPAS